MEKFKFSNPDLHILENKSIAINKEGKIEAIGDLNVNNYENYQIIDCKGKCILPGLVDPHTHACYAGDRSSEFIMKLEGATYLQIHQKGGGIYHTVDHVQKSSVEELSQILEKIVNRAIKHGTTTMEVKSGYGLSAEAEIKQLQAIQLVNKRCNIDLVATYCGAHALPKGKTEQEGAQDIINNQLPQILELKQKGIINPEFIDVFCEKSIYEIESSRAIMEAGKKCGLIPAFHGEELNHLESGVLGAEIGAISISHLEHLSEKGIEAMAQQKVVGIILPTTHFILKLRDPPVRQMIDSNVPTALGTDFCPNAHCMSIPLAMSLACINLKMRPTEAICAVTLNAAAALNRNHEIGSIEVGKLGDIIVLECGNWEHLIYQIGDSPIEKVIKKGRVIYDK